MVAVDKVLGFWLDEVGQQGWYNSTEALDQTVRDQFQTAWENACEGAYGLWLTHPNGVLAYIILTDQFPRNMFRNDPRSFATDAVAMAAAKSAIDRKWDLRVDEPARQFFYMPLMHSENLVDQERCIRLYKDRMPDTGPDHLLHARAHREIIRMFGRFPFRNSALQRRSTQEELTYMAHGGYGATVRDLQVPA